uniref:Uncharacterized protein n=1 Tax=Sphaerodactylus townsendi TaxID=933632 RepID=A0ACB8FSQ9_9SAUR
MCSRPVERENRQGAGRERGRDRSRQEAWLGSLAGNGRGRDGGKGVCVDIRRGALRLADPSGATRFALTNGPQGDSFSPVTLTFVCFRFRSGSCAFLGGSDKGRMWHEARKHERKLRGMMVDYKKRAERRREYYEKIKKDPAQFLQVHGRACKVHLDSAVALAAESPVNMMPWQGDTNNMIDRFDVRAHLDYIPMYTPPLLNPISPEQESDERKCNYERYRGLVQNDFAGMRFRFYNETSSGEKKPSNGGSFGVLPSV